MPLWVKTKKFSKLLWCSYLELCSWWCGLELCYRPIQECNASLVIISNLCIVAFTRICMCIYVSFEVYMLTCSWRNLKCITLKEFPYSALTVSLLHQKKPTHYGDVVMGTVASQISSLTIVYSTIYSDADQRKHQSSASLAFVRGIHREFTGDRWIPRTNGQ